MTTPSERATEIYYSLRPGAIAAYNAYILTRTPAELQVEMDGLLAPNQPKIMMSDGQPVVVVDAADAPVPGSPGICHIPEGLTGDGFVKLTV